VAARSHTADNPRIAALIENIDSYRDKDGQRYIHLIDGGISDNLGTRNFTNKIEAVGGALSYSKITEDTPRYIILIVVNAQTKAEKPMGQTSEPPSTGEVVSAVSSAQLGRYNTESLTLLKEDMQEWAAELSTPERPVETFLITLDFTSIEREDERAIFNNMSTSFSLPNDEVDKLIEAGHSLLEASPEYQKLVETLRRDMQ
jgi:NTE family protein